MEMVLVDRFGRPVTSIRISVTKRCNLNCFFCHREGIKGEEDTFYPEDFENLFKVAKELGIKKVKFTGGEPLERDDLEDIIKRAKNYFEDVSLTTNGTKLKGRAKDLYLAGLNRINISLQSLKPEIYRRITGRDMLKNVLEGIEDARNTPLNPIKINYVIMKGLNDSEFLDMINFVKNSNMILQVIELEVPREGENSPWYQKYHVTLDEIEKYLRSLSPEIRRNPLHNREVFTVKNDGISYTVELVKPMHNTEFCMNCTRIRFTYDGKLKPCIFRNDNLVDVEESIKNGDLAELKNLFLKAIENREPYWR